MSKPFKQLKVLRILTNGGTAEPDYRHCKTARDVLDEAAGAMGAAYDHVQPVYLLTENGWFYGEMRFEFEPVLESEVPLGDKFEHDIHFDRDQ